MPVLFSGCANSCLSLGDRQTIAPPATNSYLGQEPASIPPSAPQSGGTAGGASIFGGSLNPSGAVTFQTAEAAPPVASLVAAPPAGDWISVDHELAAGSTGQTAFQNLEARSQSITQVGADGRTVTTAVDPNAPRVSSSQIITQVSAEDF